MILEPGDRLVLYTDGITEARNITGEEFGEERLAQTLQAAAEHSAGEIVTALLDATNSFAGRVTQHDDITLIAAVRRLGEPLSEG